MKIPRTIHIVWVGNESLRPDNCIATWRELNPRWTVRVWGNHELRNLGWMNEKHIRAMETREWNGVADLMRWEILLINGGFAVDADSVCRRPLDDALFGSADGCAAYENERAAPGLLAAGYVAARPRDPLIKQIIDDVRATATVVDRPAWQSVGPMRLTNTYRRSSHKRTWRLWPSHYFMPEHHSGQRYSGPDRPYADQKWATTRRLYGSLHRTPV